MPIDWKRHAEKDPYYEEVDFQRAALRLINEQVLYHANKNQRKDHDLIAAHESAYAEVVALLGCTLDVNAQERYIAAIPALPDVSKIPVMHTLLALVLRKIYDHHMKQGVLRQGSAWASIAELEAAFNETTGRELPMRPQSRLLGLLDDMKRWGIARPTPGGNLGESDWYVEILPGIQSLIRERSLAIVEAYAESMYDPKVGEKEITVAASASAADEWGKDESDGEEDEA